jgi:hypothetical protein
MHGTTIKKKELDAFFIICVVTWSPKLGFMLRHNVECQHIHELSQLLINGGVLVD